MKKITLITAVLIAAVVCTSCTRPDMATRVLEEQGYTNIHLTGYRWFGCSDNDSFRTGFEAIKDGKAISGVVCSGLTKGNTIRLD